MKRIVTILSLSMLCLGLVGCGTNSTKESKTEDSEKIESSVSKSSSRDSTEATSEETIQSETTESVDQANDTEFKELLSGIEYNKEYLTEDQVAELKENYKSTLDENQYKELVEMLEEIHDGDT
ncbi:hypothetical protein [Enterococcus raffinosus]|uniref:Lipoprotein n=1 Tax=Enterococcus raffinosus TaxID=71452 RepID=A0AAW8T8M4_9ENTE|nr:hypothetical protein [Enterococcus raffinosus]MDT2521734.1 hypothetical protein [Enterococcus raffinosus]MDT2529043.1 hypothetical protein [Enterococcus raffinosus]MDT2532751.1 hypothetical protein [Enterococcus raffinosus]MDT2545530.1 hypothetical protein [Enterococcus raffinosus]MDT2554672.1 hypothetical protein [Enterococcus raffinosus]